MVSDWKLIVAESEGIPICAHRGIRSISLTNSPYYAHMHLSAIDLYPQRAESPALSPVEGRIIRIRSVMAPLAKYFKASDDEKLLLIDNDSKLATKILHLKPTVNVRDDVEVSTPIGEYVRSGFFNFWTPNHMHVEIRPIGDPIRARGSFPMNPAFLEDNADIVKQVDPYHILCEVISATPGLILLKPPDSMFTRLGGYTGVAVSVGKGKAGILDGGFPHYGFGGLLLSDVANVKAGDPVRIGDLVVGVVEIPSHHGKHAHNYALVKYAKGVKVKLSGRLTRGLSLSLDLASPAASLIRVVPHHPLSQDDLSTIHDKGVLSLSNIDNYSERYMY